MRNTSTPSAGPGRAPLAYGAALLLMVFLGLAAVATAPLEQGFTYALDDAYIHLAMARNLAEHGVWGVTRHGFSASSSSPLWTLLLAPTQALLPAPVLAPLALNLAFAFALVGVAARMLRRDGVPDRPAMAVLTLLVVGAPLAPLVLSGMEHVGHALVMLMLLERGSAWLVQDEPERRETLAVCALMTVAAGLRLESLALVPAAAAWLCLRGRPAHAALFATAGLWPVAAFGAWSMAHGWGFLPEPVILKAALPAGAEGMARLEARLGVITSNLRNTYFLGILVPMAAALGWEIRRAWPARAVALAAFAYVAVLQVTLGRTGWFFRYEAYLAVSGLMLVASTALSPRARDRLTSAVRPAVAWSVCALVVAFLLARGARSHVDTPAACEEIHDQQRQMAGILGEAEGLERVAINDIGAVAYFTDLEIVDLVGLATREIGDLRRAGTFDREHVGALLAERGVDWVVGYPQWVGPLVPSDWIEVGHWRLSRRPVVVAGDTVTFYARDAEGAARLADRLRAYAPRLPATVRSVVAGPPP